MGFQRNRWQRGCLISEGYAEIAGGEDRVAVERYDAHLADRRNEWHVADVGRLERDHDTPVTIFEPPHSQVFTVDKSRLDDKVGTLSAKRVREIIDGLHVVIEPRDLE